MAYYKLKEYQEILASLKNSNLLNTVDIYSKIAKDYDEINKVMAESFPCPYELLTRRLKNQFNDKLSELLLLDIGSGTGFLGEVLAKHGFKNIHALDASENMIEKSKTKNVYSKYFNVTIQDSATMGIFCDSSYDAVVSVGAFLENHVPLESLRVLTRLVRPGGYIIFTLYDPNLKTNFMQTFDSLMKEDKLELLSISSEPYKRDILAECKLVNAFMCFFKVK